MHGRVQRFLLIFLPFILAGYLPIFIAGTYYESHGLAAFEQKNYDRAADYLSNAALFLPWKTNFYEKAGLAAQSNGDAERAILLYRKSPDLSVQGWLGLASAYLAVGDIPSALQTYQSGAERFSLYPFYEGLALVYRGQKNWHAEEDSLSKAVEFGSMDAYAHYRLGLLLAEQDSAAALHELMAASSLDPEFDPAVQTMRSALNVASTQGDDAGRLILVGRALGLVSEWELALDVFEEAVRADEQNSEAWAWLGEAQQQLGQDGSEALARAFLDGEDSAIVFALRGMYWNRQGDYQSMLQDYLSAAEMDPSNPAWLAQIGNAQGKIGDLIAALSAYQKAVELSNEDPAYLRLLVLFCLEYQIHLEDVAIPSAERAVELAPQDPLALDALGWAYYWAGKYPDALSILEAAAKDFPDSAPLRLHLGLTYLAMGNRQMAYEELVFVRDQTNSPQDVALAKQLLAQYYP